MSSGPFPVDASLLAAAAARLRAHPGLRFVLGGAGTGKSTVCRSLHDSTGIPVIDMDARMYGSWGERWTPRRHPANRAWMDAPDPLGWQVSMESAAFLAFHAAATAEALDLLADELDEERADTDAPVACLVDGGFGSLAVVAQAVPPASVVCLALPADASEAVWTADPERFGFLEMVAAVEAVADPVARFLELDAALSERMVADARIAGVPVIERGPGTPLHVTAGSVAAVLRLA